LTWRSDIGESIQERRIALGMSTSRLAEKVGTSARTIRRMELGQTMGPSVLDEVLEVLGMCLVVEVVG